MRRGCLTELEPGHSHKGWSVQPTGDVDRVGRLQLVFYCNVRDKPEGLDVGEQKSKGLWAGYLFLQEKSLKYG